PWNGKTGGVLAFEASGTVTLDAEIDAAGMGFRGGAESIGTFIINAGGFVYPGDSGYSGFKGEGIAETIKGEESGRGPLATGGGGMVMLVAAARIGRGNGMRGGGGDARSAGRGGAGGGGAGGTVMLGAQTIPTDLRIDAGGGKGGDNNSNFNGKEQSHGTGGG